MAVSLKVKQKSKKSPTAMVVDRIVSLRKKIDSVAEEQKEYDKLVKQLREQAMQEDPLQEVVFVGTDHNVVFSECCKERVIESMEKVKKGMGNELFMRVASVTLRDLDRYLSPDEVNALVSVQQTGPRKIVIKERT